MKIKQIESGKEKALFWALVVPTAVFIITLIIKSEYSLVSSAIVWLLAALMYATKYKEKRETAKAFTLYSLPIIFVFVFATAFALAIGVLHV
jgi:hypothetical protein